MANADTVNGIGHDMSAVVIRCDDKVLLSLMLLVAQLSSLIHLATQVFAADVLPSPMCFYDGQRAIGNGFVSSQK